MKKWVFCSLAFLLCLSYSYAQTDTMFAVSHSWSHGLNLKIIPRDSSADTPWLYYWYTPKRSSLQSSDIDSVPLGKNGGFIIDNVLLDTLVHYQGTHPLRKKKGMVVTQQFRTSDLSAYVNVSLTTAGCKALPDSFCRGKLLFNKGTVPGGVFIADTEGRILWRKEFRDYSVKVAKFTSDTTVLVILGSEDDPTSYGRAIAEFNLKGDTLMMLGIGTHRSALSPHHEIIKTKQGMYMFLTKEDRQYDLRKIGGGIADTVSGDGIVVVDRFGRQYWSWSVFDHLNPLEHEGILNARKDWTHANGISVDEDGHYLVSFFHIEQVWKIHSLSGQVLWKLGRKSVVKTDSLLSIDQVHTFQSTGNGTYLFFDNGVKEKRTRIKEFALDTAGKHAHLTMEFPLPQKSFSPRMGSVRFILGRYYLVCASKANSIHLMDNEGNVLWTMRNNVSPYRVEFIQDDQLKHSFNRDTP